MAAPNHTRGLLAKCIRLIRTHADEKTVAARFSNSQILEFLQSAMDEIIDEVYGMADGPPMSRFNITLTADQDMYMLPCDLKEFHRAASFNDSTGLVDWEFLPGSKYNPRGPSVSLEGNRFIRFTPTPTAALEGEIVTVEYVPGGHILMHQALTACYNGLNDTGTQFWDAASTWSTGNQDYTGLSTIKLEHRTSVSAGHEWFVGEYDYRPNAFIGNMIRVLGTHDDIAPNVVTGYSYFPLQERVIVGYDPVDQIAWVEPAFGIDGADVASVDEEAIADLHGISVTYVVYEVMPVLDRGLWWLACIKAAMEIAATCKRVETVKLLVPLYQFKLRAARLRWANVQLRTGDNIVAEEDDWDEDFML